MANDTGDFDKIDEALVTHDLSDEALEAAAGVNCGRAITLAYCTNYWYCAL
jgi:hypothetical protein